MPLVPDATVKAPPKAPGLRASCPHPGWGTVLVLGGPEVPQSPHPDLAACKVGCWGGQRTGREHWSPFARMVRGQGHIQPGCEPSLHPLARDQTCPRTDCRSPGCDMSVCHASRWLFPPWCRLAWQSRSPRVLGSGCISHRRGTDGFGVWGYLRWDCPRATSPCKGGILVPRHWGGHPSRTDAGGRRTRVRPPSLCSDQR